jgi:hypothetical protein
VLEVGTGDVLVDDFNNPRVSVLTFPPIILMAGDPTLEVARQYIQTIPQLTPVVLPTDDWDLLFRRVWGAKTMGQKRTLLNPDSLDLSRIRELKEQIPDGFQLEELDEEGVRKMDPQLQTPLRNFFGVDRFIKEGFGYCMKHEGRIVSVAHTAFPYSVEFEVQVTTLNSPEYRRKGLATTVSAALIEWALLNERVPHWDAANDASVNLALKLGYSNPDVWFLYFWKEQ